MTNLAGLSEVLIASCSQMNIPFLPHSNVQQFVEANSSVQTARGDITRKAQSVSSTDSVSNKVSGDS